jgi:hypothetical protein
MALPVNENPEAAAARDASYQGPAAACGHVCAAAIKLA